MRLTIVRNTWILFWNKNRETFINSNKSEGGYDESGKFTVWPIAVFAQALVDGTRIFPQEIGPMLGPCFKVFDRYYSPKHRAYCASEFFNGNEDIYFDDNAQIASAFITAYEVTRNNAYLNKGTEIVEFLMTGLDGSSNLGGVRWHLKKIGSNTCTTAESGLAALRLAKYAQNGAQRYIEFAKKCEDWIFSKMQDPEDKLICDGLEPSNASKTEYKRNGAKWTYNQGTSLSLASILFYITKDSRYQQHADGLAAAVTNRETAIFDRDTQDRNARYYRDSTYFYQLLAEGFADYLLYFGSSVNPDLAKKVKEQALHTIQYVYKFIRDPGDGLYWQTFELFRINRPSYEAFKKLTGENKNFEPAEGERQKGSGPPGNRSMAKTFLGNGGAARVFFQSARLVPTIQ